MLSDKVIREQMLDGNIIIDSFKHKNLGTNSYDVTLGEWYFEQDDDLKVMDLRSLRDIERFWGDPNKAKDAIPLSPGHTILAHTQEIVGGRNGYVASMKARSSTARYGLSVCKCAGLGDVGYINYWTMEISNHTRTAIWLPVGMRIAQMIFHYVGETLKEYDGQYKQGEDKEFDPWSMIPRQVTI